jgi:hypothetical protein
MFFLVSMRPRVESHLVFLLSELFFFALLCLKHRKLIQKVYLYNAAALRPNIQGFSNDFPTVCILFVDIQCQIRKIGRIFRIRR